MSIVEDFRLLQIFSISLNIRIRDIYLILKNQILTYNYAFSLHNNKIIYNNTVIIVLFCQLLQIRVSLSLCPNFLIKISLLIIKSYNQFQRTLKKLPK